jgi:hypothetical protein
MVDCKIPYHSQSIKESLRHRLQEGHNTLHCHYMSRKSGKVFTQGIEVKGDHKITYNEANLSN